MFLKPCLLGLRSPASTLASGDYFVENSFSTDQGWGGGWFGDDSSTLHFLCTLLLLLLSKAPPQIIRQ